MGSLIETDVFVCERESVVHDAGACSGKGANRRAAPDDRGDWPDDLGAQEVIARLLEQRGETANFAREYPVQV